MTEEWTIQSLGQTLAEHIAVQIESDKQLSAMYKILVTGDNCPPLPETVHRHAEWIAERDKERTENRMDKKNSEMLALSDTKKDRSEANLFKRQLWLMIATQLAGFIFLGIEVFLHMK